MRCEGANFSSFFSLSSSLPYVKLTFRSDELPHYFNLRHVFALISTNCHAIQICPLLETVHNRKSHWSAWISIRNVKTTAREHGEHGEHANQWRLFWFTFEMIMNEVLFLYGNFLRTVYTRPLKWSILSRTHPFCWFICSFFHVREFSKDINILPCYIIYIRHICCVWNTIWTIRCNRQWIATFFLDTDFDMFVWIGEQQKNAEGWE